VSALTIDEVTQFDRGRLRLRSMQLEDIPRIADIDSRAYEFPWTPGIFTDCLRAGYTSMVLEDDEGIVGYAIFTASAHEAHLLNVCVVPDRQGEGCGRRLVKRVLDLARWQRCERVFLEVRPTNTHAIALYHDLGFNEIAARPKYYPARDGAREDATVMALELLPPE